MIARFLTRDTGHYSVQRRQFLSASAGIIGASICPSLLLANTASPKWSKAAPIPINVQEIYAAVHDNKIIVAGGIAAKLGVPYFTDAAFAYDPGTDTWGNLPDLPEPLHHVALVSTGTELWAIGGFNGGYSHIWRMRDKVYKLQADRWEPQPSLPGLQAEGVATSHKGNIHVVAGQQPRGEANSARSDHHEVPLHWYWDGTTWASLAPIPTPRNSATGGWIDNQLVVAGGRTAQGNLTVTEIYDAKEDPWRTAAPMPLPQAGTASVVHDNSLIVFGGEIFIPEAAVFPNVWRYRIDTDRWEKLPDMVTPRHGLGAGLIGDRAYVVAGATRPSGKGTSDLNEVLVLS